MQNTYFRLIKSTYFLHANVGTLSLVRLTTQPRQNGPGNVYRETQLESHRK
uniref:Uncharacterized protein n=1 Tax=Anguilla anguilla TaxID=7936 RepID=A0A0E9S114_ANGAN